MAHTQENRQAVARILREYPDTPYAQIARQLGITKERVRQLAVAIGFERPARAIAPVEAGV